MLLEQGVLAVLLSLLFAAALLATDTQGLGTLVATSGPCTVTLVLLGAMTSLAPIIMATQIWSLGQTRD